MFEYRVRWSSTYLQKCEKSPVTPQSNNQRVSDIYELEKRQNSAPNMQQDLELSTKKNLSMHWFKGNV